MEPMIVERVAPNWRATLKGEDPRNTFDRKLAQAESLAHLMVGEGFQDFNDVIQNNVQWLLSDLLTEIREAHEDWEKQS